MKPLSPPMLAPWPIQRLEPAQQESGLCHPKVSPDENKSSTWGKSAPINHVLAVTGSLSFHLEGGFTLCVCVCVFVCVSCSVISDSSGPHGLYVARQALLSMGFSRQEYWSGLPFPSPGDLPDRGVKLGSPALQVNSLPSEPPQKPSFTINYMKRKCFLN